MRRETSPIHAHSKHLTQLAREVYRKYNPEWIVPLDADEFLVMKATLDDLPRGIHVSFPVWRNYTPTINDVDDLNVLKRIKHRTTKIDTNQHKVIIPSEVIGLDTYLSEGGHEAHFRDGRPVPYSLTDVAHIAHFPVRSSDQFQRKALVGWPAKLASPYNKGKAPVWFHWKLFFDKAKRGGTISVEELQKFAVGYTIDQKLESLEIIEDPIVFTSEVCVKYPPKPYPPLTALADSIEMLAYLMLGRHTQIAHL